MGPHSMFQIFANLICHQPQTETLPLVKQSASGTVLVSSTNSGKLHFGISFHFNTMNGKVMVHVPITQNWIS
mgnify:CR=1 FL=1